MLVLIKYLILEVAQVKQELVSLLNVSSSANLASYREKHKSLFHSFETLMEFPLSHKYPTFL